MRRHFHFVAVAGLLLMSALPGHAAEPGKGQPPDALTIIREAVQAELNADQNDHSRWRYRDEQRELNDSVSIVVQTDQGSVKRLIARGGRPLSPDEARQEEDRLNRFIHDPAKLARQRRDGEQDDKNARDLLSMLPDAFLWSVERYSSTAVTLHFEPNPNFHPPTLQSRVFAVMNGTVVVDKMQHRIVTMSGRLTEDVTFGFGLLGRMKEGGTFRVERRQLAPGLWQITETHVNIDGKALLFKNIGQQQDELQTDFTPVPGGTTLEQAVALSRPQK
jgi:hypothetical protein